MVKRYDIADDDDSGDVSMMEFEDGEYVTFAEYDALAARLAVAVKLLQLASDICGGWRGELIDAFLRPTVSASACPGGAPHWWDINAVTGQSECRLCHKSPSAKESL